LAAVLEQLGRIDEVISPSARKEKSII